MGGVGGMDTEGGGIVGYKGIILGVGEGGIGQAGAAAYYFVYGEGSPSFMVASAIHFKEKLAFFCVGGGERMARGRFVKLVNWGAGVTQNRAFSVSACGGCD